MADTEVNGPRLPDEYMAEALRQFNQLLESCLNDVYRLGFSDGDTTAINRILKAAQSDRNEPDTKPDRPMRTSKGAPAAPGAKTHKLIEAALRAYPSGKATPTEIATSPANKDGIARDAIRNALRRGRSSGRYVSDGRGRYSLGRTQA